MTTTPEERRTGFRISIVDEDPLRARKEARDLLAQVADADPEAALDVPRRDTGAPADVSLKGGLTADTIGVLISAGSMVAAGVQIWLARVPQRTIVVKRPDGATLHITGKEAREDDERIERFLAGGGEASRRAELDGPGDSPAAG
ncbi:effector-associated constant component EACC1 [Streptomyces anthocyanicus]|uniref:effector-associated constant component EACC1 n=1 Tax=Streptomyces anthocyanicus TaxID=68174 RepID=UPI00384ADF87